MAGFEGERRPASAQPPRMAALARLPVFLALEGKRAVVAGNGPAAAWKAELLSAAGAAVDVFADHPSEELRAVAAQAPRGVIAIHERGWQARDFVGVAIAVGGFDDDADAQAFASAARAAGVPVNVIDKPAHCDFSFGASLGFQFLVYMLWKGGTLFCGGGDIDTSIQTFDLYKVQALLGSPASLAGFTRFYELNKWAHSRFELAIVGGSQITRG